MKVFHSINIYVFFSVSCLYFRKLFVQSDVESDFDFVRISIRMRALSAYKILMWTEERIFCRLIYRIVYSLKQI